MAPARPGLVSTAKNSPSHLIPVALRAALPTAWNFDHHQQPGPWAWRFAAAHLPQTSHQFLVIESRHTLPSCNSSQDPVKAFICHQRRSFVFLLYKLGPSPGSSPELKY